MIVHVVYVEMGYDGKSEPQAVFSSRAKANEWMASNPLDEHYEYYVVEQFIVDELEVVK